MREASFDGGPLVISSWLNSLVIGLDLDLNILLENSIDKEAIQPSRIRTY